MEAADHPFSAIEETFKRAVAALEEADIPFLLGGTIACWALGGPQARKDLDLMVKPEHAETALSALTEIGMKPDRPPEGWLLKAWDGEVLVDLIFGPTGFAIGDDVIGRGQLTHVWAMDVRVMAPEDILVSKLLALGEHALDLESSLQIARSLREQIDWADVRRRTTRSPYARAFMQLVGELGIAGFEQPAAHARVRVVE
jgi:hypothetical protein